MKLYRGNNNEKLLSQFPLIVSVMRIYMFRNITLTESWFLMDRYKVILAILHEI